MGRKRASKKVVVHKEGITTKEVLRPIRPSDDYPTPMHEYIFSPEQVIYSELAERWKGVPGWKPTTIHNRGQEEGWPRRRREFWEGVHREVENRVQGKIAETMAENIVETNNRHIAFGRLLQSFGKAMMVVDSEGTIKIKDPTTGNYIAATTVGDAIRFIREGAEMERKAFGLADQVVRVQFARDVGKKYFDIIKKYIDDPALLRNIMTDFEEDIQKEVDELGRMTSGEQ